MEKSYFGSVSSLQPLISGRQNGCCSLEGLRTAEPSSSPWRRCPTGTIYGQPSSPTKAVDADAQMHVQARVQHNQGSLVADLAGLET